MEYIWHTQKISHTPSNKVLSVRPWMFHISHTKRRSFSQPPHQLIQSKAFCGRKNSYSTNSSLCWKAMEYEAADMKNEGCWCIQKNTAASELHRKACGTPERFWLTGRSIRTWKKGGIRSVTGAMGVGRAWTGATEVIQSRTECVCVCQDGLRSRALKRGATLHKTPHASETRGKESLHWFQDKLLPNMLLVIYSSLCEWSASSARSCTVYWGQWEVVDKWAGL